MLIVCNSPLFSIYTANSNIVLDKSNHKNLGTIKSSNLCTEIIEYSAPDETAVCNLASLVFPTFIVKLVERDGNYQYKTWIGSPTQLGKLQYDLWGVTSTELVGLKEKIAAMVLETRSCWHLCLQLQPVRFSEVSVVELCLERVSLVTGTPAHCIYRVTYLITFIPIVHFYHWHPFSTPFCYFTFVRIFVTLSTDHSQSFSPYRLVFAFLGENQEKIYFTSELECATHASASG